MKAVIMAGGFGTRLRPLTERVPKPCVTVMGEPCIVRIIRQLRSLGIVEFHISLFFLPDNVREILSSPEFRDLNLVFHQETVPLGTAGSVRNCLGDSDEEFLVVSADAVFDFDLAPAIAAHRSFGGPVTILSSRVSDPGEYGVMLCDGENRVTRFLEKPDWAHSYSDDVNTGIYIASPSFLDCIPDGPADFSRDVFPRMLQKDVPIYRFPTVGFWCDIGTVPSYLQCNRHLLSDRGDVILSPVDEDTVIESPCYIGRNVLLRNCHIGPYTVIEDGCDLQGARLEGCVLHSKVRCSSGVVVRNAVLCKNVILHSDARIGDECVVGAECEIGRGTTLSAKVKIYPSNRIPPDSYVSENVHHQLRNPLPEQGKVLFPFGEDFGGAMIYEIGRALALLFDGDILVGRWEQKDAAAVMTFCGGVLACGKNVYDTGVNELSRFRFALRNYAFHGGAYFERNYSNLILRLYDADGMPLSSDFSRKLLRMISAETSCGEQTGMYRIFRGGTKSYLKFLRSFGIPSGLPLRVVSSPFLSVLLPSLPNDHAQERMRVGSEWVRIEGSDGEPYDENLIRLCALVALGKKQSPVFFPADYPSVTESVAEQFGFRAIRCSEGEELKKLFPLTDSNVCALLILGLLDREGCSFAQFAERLPSFVVKQRDVPVAASRSSVMRFLASSGGELGTGIRFSDPVGSVRIVPKDRANAFRVISEACSAEQAEELCEFYSLKLKGLKPD